MLLTHRTDLLFLSNLHSFCFFSYFIALARASGTTLSELWCSCLLSQGKSLPSRSQEESSRLLLAIVSRRGFLYMFLVSLRKFLSIVVCFRVYIRNKYWILSNAFLESNDYTYNFLSLVC
jgi:hypothetical protein